MVFLVRFSDDEYISRNNVQSSNNALLFKCVCVHYHRIADLFIVLAL